MLGYYLFFHLLVLNVFWLSLLVFIYTFFQLLRFWNQILLILISILEDPVSWGKLKQFLLNIRVQDPSFTRTVVVGTCLTLCTVLSTGTGFGPVIQRVILVFFPSVTFSALILIGATIIVFGDKIFRLPVLAGVRIVVTLVGLTSEVLPVVGVDAHSPVVLHKIKWAPDWLVVENIKIVVKIIVVD